MFLRRVIKVTDYWSHTPWYFFLVKGLSPRLRWYELSCDFRIKLDSEYLFIHQTLCTSVITHNIPVWIVIRQCGIKLDSWTGRRQMDAVRYSDKEETQWEWLMYKYTQSLNEHCLYTVLLWISSGGHCCKNLYAHTEALWEWCRWNKHSYLWKEVCAMCLHGLQMCFYFKGMTLLWCVIECASILTAQNCEVKSQSS